MLSHPLTNFEIQNIIKMSLDLMYLFQAEFTNIKGWGIYNKS